MSVKLENFNPFEYATIPATTTSANVAFSTNAGNDLRIFNSGTSVAFVKWGHGAAQVATSTTGLPIAPGATEVVYSGGINNVAAIVTAGSANVYVARGEGSR